MKSIERGMKVAQLRKEKGWTQQELSKKLHIAQNTLSQYENGVRIMEDALFEECMKIFGIENFVAMDLFKEKSLFSLKTVTEFGYEEYVKRAMVLRDSPEDHMYACFEAKHEFQELSKFMCKEEHGWCSLSIFLAPEDYYFENPTWILRLEKDGEIIEDELLDYGVSLMEIYKKANDMMVNFQLSWEKEIQKECC